jgi:hypothetical protein
MIPHISSGRQRGLVLVVAMIMLLAVTLMVVAASNLVQANLKVVQNMEIREQARAAGLAAIEEVISNGTAAILPRFIEFPDDVFLESCDGALLTCTKVNNLKYYDTNADNVADISVQLSVPGNALYPPPQCVLARTKTVNELEDSERDLGCDGSLTSTLLPGAGKSWCAESIWELKALATDLVTGAEIVVRQGVSVSITLNDKLVYCP